jgi:uncharacterized protein YjiS (DUF1127 family)
MASGHLRPRRPQTPSVSCWHFSPGAPRLRQRRAMVEMLDLDAARLRDLGVTRADIAEALKAEKGRTPGMVLNAARARAARS